MGVRLRHEHANMIDHLKDHAVRSLEDYQCPPIETQLKNKNSSYKAMSAMQKAIRFGDVDSAQRAAHALVSSGFAGTCSATWTMIPIQVCSPPATPPPESTRSWASSCRTRRARTWSGIRTPLPLTKLSEPWPDVGYEIVALCSKLEEHYYDMMDVEFTVQDKKLFLLQCRAGKRSSLAKLQIAYDLLQENVIDLETALSRFTRSDIKRVLQPQIDPAFKVEPEFVGIGSTREVAIGRVVLTAQAAIEAKEPVMLAMRLTRTTSVAWPQPPAS